MKKSAVIDEGDVYRVIHLFDGEVVANFRSDTGEEGVYDGHVDPLIDIMHEWVNGNDELQWDAQKVVDSDFDLVAEYTDGGIAIYRNYEKILTGVPQSVNDDTLTVEGTHHGLAKGHREGTYTVRYYNGVNIS